MLANISKAASKIQTQSKWLKVVTVQNSAVSRGMQCVFCFHLFYITVIALVLLRAEKTYYGNPM